MSSPEMTAQRVFELIEAYGAEPGAWPADERDAAAALTQKFPDKFEDALKLAHMLDDAIAAEQCLEPSRDLADRILASAPQPKAGKRSILSGLASLLQSKGVRWPAGATLASLAVGIVGGYAYASTGTLTHEEVTEVYFSALGYDADAVWITEDES